MSDHRQVIAAIFGFLGVVVGALATSVSNWYFARRRERSEGKVATRLVREDVVLAGATLSTVLRSGWQPEFALPLEHWREHRSVLAAHLSPGDWERVAIAMGSVERIEVMLASVGGNRGIESEHIPDDGREIIESTVRYLKDARNVLTEDSQAKA